MLILYKNDGHVKKLCFYENLEFLTKSDDEAFIYF